MRVKTLLSSWILFSSSSLLYGINVTDGNSLSEALHAGTATITFQNNITLTPPITYNAMPLLTLPILYPVNANADFSANSNTTLINGATFTLNGNNAVRGFFVRGGTSVAINDLTFSQTAAIGGSGGPGGTTGGGGGGGAGLGGALYVCNGATVTLTNTTFTNSTATGGAGGSLSGTNTSGGGGGGLTGAGGAASSTSGAGGGGGGFAFSGGTANAADSGGGGGGGCGQAGANSTSATGGNGGGNFTPAGEGIGGAQNMNGGAATLNGAGGGGAGLAAAAGGVGGAGFIGGGGGGGGFSEVPSSAPNGGTGGNYAGGGGGGHNAPLSTGSSLGGNGGSGSVGGIGGGGGGGGGSTPLNFSSDPATGGNGGQAGFGGGGGGGGGAAGILSTPGTGGSDTFNLGGSGANGTTIGGAGGGGAALGGAVFIENAGVVNFDVSVTFGTGGSGNSVTGGTGATAGAARGQDIFMQNGASLNFNLSSPLTLSNPIQSENQNTSVGGGVSVGGTSSVNFTGLNNTYMGTTTISSNGTLVISSDNNLGFGGSAASNPLVMNSGNPTLEIAGTMTLAPARNLNVNFVSSGTATFKIDAGASLTYAGDLDLGAGNLAVNLVNGMSACNLSGGITGASSNVTVSGLGTLTYSGGSKNLYGGTTTINGGTLVLNKSGVAAFGGDVVVNSGGTLTQQAAAQIPNTSNMTLNGTSIFNVGGFNTGLNSLTFNGGTINPGGATLTLGSTTNSPAALTMQGGTTLSAPLDFSNTTSFIVFDQTNNGTATISGNINLEGGTTTFNIGAGSAATDMIVSGAISNGSISLTGLAGKLQFAGTAANTYSGTTTVSSGILQLNKTAGMFAIPGDLTINGGTVRLLAADQIIHTSNMVLSSGIFDMQTFPATLNTLTFTSGTLTQASTAAILTLESTSASPAALTQQTGTTIPGPLVFSAGAFVDLTGASGTALIGPGTVGLGGGLVTFDTGGSTGSVMQISGAISNGSLTVTGSGLLNLTGTNTYVGPTTVSSGTLAVNGSITSNTTVAVSGTLKGTGTITGNVDIFGTMSPGNSVGTLNITGTYEQHPGSTRNNEITPTTTDLVRATGNVTIDPGATFALMPDPGMYTAGKIYEVIESTGGTVTGTFSNFTNSNPMVKGHLFYTTTGVFFEIDQSGLVLMVTTGNAGKVAAALDAVVASGNTSLDPLIMTLVTLRGSQLVNALNQLQPSLYKGMAIVQQNNAVKVHDALGYRFQNVLDATYSVLEVDCVPVDENSWKTKRKAATELCNICEPEKKLVHIWIDGLGDFINQGNTHSFSSAQVGYRTTTAGVVGGIDFNFADYFYVGALGAYTHSNVNWKNHQGKGQIDSSYAGLYASGIGKIFYGNVAVIRSWNHYHARRNIKYPGMNQSPRNHHTGNQVLTHFDTGLNFGVGGVTIRPFDSFDYITQQEQQFKEHGGGVTNLSVRGKTFRMVRNELGLNFAKSFCFNRYELNKIIIDAKLSWVREVRLKGTSSVSEFVGTGVHYTTEGYYPNRSLFSPGLSLSFMTLNDLLVLTAYYNGEFGSKYRDQSVGLEIGFQF